MSDPLRVLHVVEASFEGVGQHVLDLSGYLRSRGDEVHVAWCPDRATDRFVDELQSIPGVRSHRLPHGCSSLTRLAAALGGVRSALEGFGSDGPHIVHGHSSIGGAWARSVRTGARRVYTPNALITQAQDRSAAAIAAYRLIEVIAGRFRTDALIHVSPEERDHAVGQHIVANRQVVIPNGIELVALPSQSESRRDLGLETNGPVVGFVGRLAPQKGVDRLLDAWALIPESERQDAVLALVGEGDLEDELRRSAGEHDLGDSVRFLGRRHGQNAMAAFDVFVLPSRYEGFPYALLEAMWGQCAVVVSTGAAASAVVEHARTGLITDGTPQQLAEAVRELFSDPAKIERLASSAHVAVQDFSVEAMGRSTRDLYCSLMQGEAT